MSETNAAVGVIGARLDRLASSRTIWILVILISCGSFFEGYTILLPASIAPGIVKGGILTATTTSFFGMTGYASFVAATFAGFLVGTACFSFIADRFGRRTIFTVALLWFSVASAIMAFQHTANGLNLWRFLSTIGIGVEMVTIDAYLSELMPKASRGKAFALGSAITFASSPVCAFLAFQLIATAPLGLDGWRWVVLAGSLGAIIVWPLRLGIPESPRWLATHGRIEAADRVVAGLEARVARETGVLLPLPAPVETIAITAPAEKGRYTEIFTRAYRSRTIMLSLFNVFQAIGLYGFGNWVPTLLVQQGVSVTHSLGYVFGMQLAAPLGPLAAMAFADRVERKWQIVGAALVIAVAGLAFAQLTNPYIIIPVGAIQTLTAAVLNYSFHSYQAELYPTRIRAQAIGFVYSWSRLSGAFSGFLIAFVLGHYGVPSVFLLIAGSMAVVALSIGAMGPPTSRRALEALAR